MNVQGTKNVSGLDRQEVRARMKARWEDYQAAHAKSQEEQTAWHELARLEDVAFRAMMSEYERSGYSLSYDKLFGDYATAAKLATDFFGQRVQPAMAAAQDAIDEYVAACQLLWRLDNAR